MAQYLIYSDSHGDGDSVFKIIERHASTLDGILFLGDGAEEAVEAAYSYETIPFYAVTGNNDFNIKPHSIISFPLERVEHLSGITIYMTHGHIASYREVELVVARRGEMAGASLALYGHLHIPAKIEHQERNIITLNPGSISYPRGGSLPSYLLLTVGEDGAMTLQFHHAKTGALIDP